MTVSPTVGDEAAEDGGVDDDLDLDLLAGGLARAPRRGGACWSSVERRSAERTSATASVALGGGPLDELVDDRGQVAAAAGADDERDQADVVTAMRLAAEQVLDDRLAPARRGWAGR